MTPWLSTLRVVGLLLVLTTGAGHPSYAAEHAPYATGHPSYAAEHAAPYTARPAPSADASRAGSVPGEGRARPGRAEPAAPDDPDDPGTEDGEPTGPVRDPDVPDRSEASAAPEPSRDPVISVHQNVVGRAPTPEPVLQILPLGSGLILIGLGLGLAFVALRVRRG